MLKRLIKSCLLLLPVITMAQNSGSYFIDNYSRSHYQASISNFDVIQGDNGIIYVANYDGILLYNGRHWNAIPADNGSMVYSLGKDQHGRIYVGTKNGFGYLTAGEQGQLQYISLADKLPKETTASSIRKITTTEDAVYFFSTEAIFVLKNSKLKVLSEAGKDFKFTVVDCDNEVYCLQQGRGLVNLATDSVLIRDPANEWSAVTFMTNLSNKILIGTASSGLYELEAGQLTMVTNPLSQYLSSHILFTGTEMKFGDSTFFVFGTLNKGILKVNETLNSMTIIDKNQKLQSEIIKGLNLDQHLGVWTAMQEGVSHIELNSPLTYWNKENNLHGTPWEIKRVDKHLYIGTTTGLFYYSRGNFKKIEGIESKVWSIGSINDPSSGDTVLLAGTDKGLYKINKGKHPSAESVLDFPSISLLYSPHSHSNEMFVGHFKGISKVSLQHGQLTSKSILNIPASTFNSIVLHSGDLWASLKFTGICHVTTINDSINYSIYNQSNGLPDVNKINVIEKKGRLLFSTDHGFYRFTGPETGFVRDSSLIESEINIDVITKTSNESYFASVATPDRNEHVEKFVKTDSGYFRQIIPFRRLPEMEIFSIYPEDNGITWIAGSEGLFRYDENVQKDYTLPFNTVVSKVDLGDSTIFHGFYPRKIEGSDIPGISIEQPESYIPTLTFDNNNITFEYSATFYEVPEKNQFSYFLANNDKGWSNWSYETKKEYTNLAPGKYTFHVKSKNIYDTEGKVATYQFVILAPWYRTSWAYAGFSVLGGSLIWLITMAYSLRVRIQRKKLRLIVADRTYEVMSQKKEIEKQNALLKTKNEEISKQRDDIESKNKQLQDSQEEILNMNQRLTELNTYLEKKVEKRTSKIKATLKELQKINLELDTFVYRASHDLKGPISRINGITSLAKLESPDTINMKYFNLIEETAKDMGVLLSKLAQVHEIINTRIDKEEIDIPSLLSEVREDVKFLDKGRNTKYSFDLEAIMLNSDRYLVGIIIKNLVENALIFRKNPEKESHHIQISTSSSNGMFRLKIRDNGIGIQTEHTNKVFQMFFRGSDKSKGSGLGLYLVKMCLDKLNATVILESKENEFTEFTIEIPA